MAGADTFTFTDANFEAEALKSPVPVLVDFWAEWCGPCRMLGPTIDQIATELKGKAKIGKLDVDSNQQTAMNYGVQSIPMCVLLKDGKPVAKWVGIRPKAEYVNALTAAM
ncbi:MAG: thioredoxin [Phycisphaerales bacterium]